MDKNSNALASKLGGVIDYESIRKDMIGFVAKNPLENKPKIKYQDNSGKTERRETKILGEEKIFSDTSVSLQESDPVGKAKPRINQSLTPRKQKVEYHDSTKTDKLMNFSDEDVRMLMTQNPAMIETGYTEEIKVPKSIDDNQSVKNTSKEYGSHKEIKLPSIEDLPRAVSKISNMVKEYMYEIDLFNEIRDSLTQKGVFHEPFLKKFQNCVYHSLIDFCNVVNTQDNKKVLPEISETSSFLPTLYFLDRIYHDKRVSFESTIVKLMVKYRRIFKDYDGIQVDWIELLRSRMKEKMPLDDYGINQVIEKVADLICMKIEPVIKPSKVEVIQSPLTKDDEEYIDDDDNNDNDIDVSIEVPSDSEAIHQLTIYQSDNIAIPIYFTLDQIHNIRPIKSKSGDERNGVWDHLIHFRPIWMTKTKNPDKYLECNQDSEITYNKCVIMKKLENEEYVIGSYRVNAIYGANAIDEMDIKSINYLVLKNLANNNISHLTKSLTMEELFMNENEVSDHVENFDSNEDSEEEVVEEAVEESVDEDGEGFIDGDNEEITEEVDPTQLAMDSIDEEEEEVEDQDDSIPDEEEIDPENDQETDESVSISSTVPDDVDDEKGLDFEKYRQANLKENQ